MAFQTIFKRYEMKYILRAEQKDVILRAMAPYMKLDDYGRSVIRNLYFDTDDYRLIRHSIEKPTYKEKLRIRSYAQANADSTVFVELKKKYKGIVYKRRVSLPEAEAMDWVCRKAPCKESTQITREIDYFIDYYRTLHPTAFLSFEREAYYTLEPSDFRVTFDEQILCRQTDLSLCSPPGGTSILPAGLVLMEIKCSGGLPMWMTRALSENHLYKTSFSKYGTAYQTMICPQLYPCHPNSQNLLTKYAYEEEFIHA